MIQDTSRPAAAPAAGEVSIGAGDRPAMAALARLQYEPAEAGWVLLHPAGRVRLNLPAAEILMRCDGRRSVQEIVAELEEAFSGPALREDVQSFLAEARGQGWIALESA